MRNKFSRKINTAIELTSLLDVIFIVLMIIVCNQQINMTAKTEEAQAVLAQAEEKMDQAEDIMAEAEAQKELYKEDRDTYESINEQTDIMTVYVTYTPSNPEDREILIMRNGEELPHIFISPSNTTEALEGLTSILDKHVSAAHEEDKPVIVSINTDKILYRDEKAVSEILDGLSEEYGNIFYKREK